MLKIIKFFINRPKIVNLIIIFIILAGGLGLFMTKKEGYPKIDFGQVNISTTYPGASPKDVELKVTTKIEEKLKEVSGIKEIKSWSIENFSNINIEMDDNANTRKVKEDIKDAVDQVAEFPDGVDKPVVSLLDIDSFPVIEVAITGDVDYKTKRIYADSLERKLLRDKFVGSVMKVGYLDREIKIEVSQNKLIKNYISFGELMTAIKNQNFRMSSGDLITENEKKIVVMSEFEKLTDVKNVIVRSGYEGKQVLVSDVAIIKDEFEKPDHLIKYNGQESINLVIVKKPNADIIKSTKSMKKIISKFEKDLPPGLKVKFITDYSVDVKNLLALVVNNAWFGFILVIVVLVLMLNLRLAFWTSIGIPTSILITFMLFPVLGINIDFITLTAIIIVLGMLVDDAIIIGENIYRYREQGMPAEKAAYQGVKEVMWPVISTILTTIIVFMPMMGMTGILGKFMKTMPIVVMLMLGASLIEALFLLPTHVAHIKMRKKKSLTLRIFHKFEDVYEKFVSFTLKNKWKTILIFIGIFAVSLVLLLTGIMKFMLFPSNDGIYGYVKFETEQGTKLEVTADKVKKIEQILLDMQDREVKRPLHEYIWLTLTGKKPARTKMQKEIHGFVTNVGERTPSIESFGDGPVTSGFVGNITIYLTPMKTRDRTLIEIMEDIKKQVAKIEGFTKIEADKVSEGPPVGKPVTVTFVSNNDQERERMARELKKYLHTQSAVSNIQDNQGEGKKQLQILFDYDMLSRLGLDPLTVSSIIRSAFEGTVVTSLKWKGEDVDYRIILNEESRKSIETITSLAIENLKSLTIQNKFGKLIPLGQFVTLKEINDKLMINHFDGDRSITIYADLDTKRKTANEINAQIRNKFQPKVDSSPGMEMVFGGEEQDTMESMFSLGLAFILAIIGVYFILVFLFNSFTQPFLVMLTIPFAFAGVVFVFFFHRMPFSFMAIIGMIGLTGVVVNDSLVMITFLNNQRKKCGLSVAGLAQAAKHRLRPIILTTSTTAAGLFPSAYGFGGDNPFIIPMIMAIAWGLIFATVITLILIPSLYMALMKGSENVKWIFKKECIMDKPAAAEAL